MVLGFKPVDKPIIPRRSFFDKAYFLGYTGMFSVTTYSVEFLVHQHKAAYKRQNGADSHQPPSRNEI